MGAWFQGSTNEARTIVVDPLTVTGGVEQPVQESIAGREISCMRLAVHP